MVAETAARGQGHRLRPALSGTIEQSAIARADQLLEIREDVVAAQ
jgi:hypothetical protein